MNIAHFMDVLAIVVFHILCITCVKSVVSLCGCSLDPVLVRIRGSICVGVDGIVWPLGACGGGVLWLVGFEKRVKVLVGGDSLVIVYVAVICVFCVDVITNIIYQNRPAALYM
jgi:hypothetical protein